MYNFNFIYFKIPFSFRNLFIIDIIDIENINDIEKNI
jgi:hypothetical protein